jgi:hypothetical protein
MTTFKAELQKIGACQEAIDWVGKKTFKTAWVECERADWMLWLVGKMQGQKGWPTHQQIVLVACDCAELVLPIYEKKYPKDKRVRECLETTRKWAKGEATIEEVHAAANAAYAAANAAAYAAANAAAYDDAANAANYAAYAAANAANAAANDAANAAANAAAYAAAYDAKKSMQKRCANLCRKHLSVPKKFNQEQ